jgi:hypothetical protein
LLAFPTEFWFESKRQGKRQQNAENFKTRKLILFKIAYYIVAFWFEMPFLCFLYAPIYIFFKFGQ